MAKEYIEREALKKKISKIKVAGAFTESFKNVTMKIISEEPTADVQEIVRCKDCIFGKYDDDLNMILCKQIYNLSDGECVYNDLNDFCSFGAKWIRSEQE